MQWSTHYCKDRACRGVIYRFRTGNHADLYEIGQRGDEIVAPLKKRSLRAYGLFNNADAGFDARYFRLALESHRVTANVCPQSP